MVGSNLSGFTNPEKIQYLLQLWETSRYLHLIKKKTLLKFIRDTENNFKKIKPSNNLNITNYITSILKNYLSSLFKIT